MLKILIRVVLVVLGLILVLVIGLVGTVAIDGVSMRGQVDALTNTSISNSAGPEIRAYVARPSTPGPHPAVIMIHEFWGIREELIGKADDLAAQGYLVVAPDLFRGRTTNMVPSAIYNVVSNQPTQIDGDMASVFAWVSTQPDVKADRIAIMGFCFGGGTAIRYSVSNPKLAGTVVFYGTPVTDAAKLKSLSGPVLGIFGGADTSIPLEEVRAFEAGLKEAGVPNEITVYDGQPHAFVTDMAAIRAGGPQGQAWAQLLTFLDSTLKQGAIERRDVAAQEPGTDIDYGYLLRLAYEHALGHGAAHH